MNRAAEQFATREAGMPHVCGDEPGQFPPGQVQPVVCPTYVGMNRWLVSFPSVTPCMPHVCGDEPELARIMKSAKLYAPRMWG